MSVMTGTWYSKALNMDTSFCVILPHDSRMHRGIEPLAEGIKPSAKPKTLILLHGLSDNWAAWAHRTSILRYAEMYDIAVVIPEVQRSFYQDMAGGPAYFTYIAEELPALAAQMFNISTAPGDLMAAGLSMGGYGALYCGLCRPEAFRMIGCFSGANDLHDFSTNKAFLESEEFQGWANDRLGIFGAGMAVPAGSDLFALAEALSPSLRPHVFMTCGTEDFIYQHTVKMRDHLQKLGYQLGYKEWPGVHEWGVWDLSIQMMLEHFLAP